MTGVREAFAKKYEINNIPLKELLKDSYENTQKPFASKSKNNRQILAQRYICD
jgi:hypothetical protein